MRSVSRPPASRCSRLTVLIIAVAAPLLGACATTRTAPPLPVAEPSWELGSWVQGGGGLAGASSFRFVASGVRVGRVLSSETGSGRLRGTFAIAADLMPLFSVRQLGEWLYGGSFGLALKWNFVAAERVVPYVAAEGGLLFTRKEVPPGDTSRSNFTAGGAFGLYLPVPNGRAVDFSVHVTHISNGGLSDFNPGINATLQVRLGYTWFMAGR